MKKIRPQKIAIIGDPVGHSLSPAMQNAAFRAKKLSLHYSKIRLTKKQLGPFFSALKKGRFLGLNVTVPHKENVLPFLDVISPEARMIGAVNTIVVEKGRVKGFNTDGAGYLLSLRKELRFSPRGKRVVLLGAGGAARAILVSLFISGARKVTIANRSLAKAKKMAHEFQKKFPRIRLKALSLKSKDLTSLFRETDLLINATSAGLKGRPFPSLPLEALPRHAIVSDIVYRPVLTDLLKQAKNLGRKIHKGLGMLLYQGAFAFELWTGKKAPVPVMRGALNRVLLR